MILKNNYCRKVRHTCPLLLLAVVSRLSHAHNTTRAP